MVRNGTTVNVVYTSILIQAYFMLTLNYRVDLATEGSSPPRRMHVPVVFALCYPLQVARLRIMYQAC